MKVTKQAIHKEEGIVLIGVLGLLSVIALMATLSVTSTFTEIKISSNYKTGVQADNIARGGVEHARLVLKTLNAASTDPDSFSDELIIAAGDGLALEGYTGVDDVPIVDTTSLGNGSYTVYLTNDPVDGSTNQTDSNNTACLTSVATTSEGSKSIVEMTISIVAGGSFTPPGTVALLGSGAVFWGGTSQNGKAWHGDDQCGSYPGKPVVATSDAADVSTQQWDIMGPDTYHTKDSDGNPVTFSDDPDAIVAAIPQSEIDSMNSNIGVDFLDPVSLDNWVADIQAQADTVAPDGSTDATVNLGNTSDPQIVVVTGDFNIEDNIEGAGILVVTGVLHLYGAPNYDGLILAIGDGVVYRYSAGSLTDGVFNGSIIIADTVGSADGPRYDVSGHGRGTMNYCSTAVDNALSLIPSSTIKPVAVKEL